MINIRQIDHPEMRPLFLNEKNEMLLQFRFVLFFVLYDIIKTIKP